MRVIVMLSLAVVSAGFAAEKEDKIVPITQPRDDTAISATRREFETIKSARDPAMQQKGEVPRLSMPEMPTSGIGTGWTPPKTNAPEKKSPNWLVDAMESRAAEDKAHLRDKLDPERERNGLGRTSDELLSGEKRTNGDREEGQGAGREGERNSPTTVMANPLARYLGDWMTPQDYSLLKPSLAQSSANTASAFNRDVGSGAALPIPGATALTGVAGQTRLAPHVMAPIAGAKPKENPFLQALNATAPAGPANAPTSFASPTPVASTPMIVPSKAPLPLVPPPPTAEPAKSRIPEFVKPADDEKYFKQLKRF